MRQTKLFLGTYDTADNWRRTVDVFQHWCEDNWVPLESSLRIDNRTIAVIFVKDEPVEDPIANLRL